MEPNEYGINFEDVITSSQAARNIPAQKFLSFDTFEKVRGKYLKFTEAYIFDYVQDMYNIKLFYIWNDFLLHVEKWVFRQ